MWPGGRAIFPLASFPGTTKFLGAAALCCPDLRVTFEFPLLALRTSRGGRVEPLLTSGGGNAPAVQSPGPAPTQLWFGMSDKGRLSLQP